MPVGIVLGFPTPPITGLLMAHDVAIDLSTFVWCAYYILMRPMCVYKDPAC